MYGLHFLLLLQALQARVGQVSAQVSLSTKGCVTNYGFSSFSACNYLFGQISYCAGPQVATGAPAVSCYCNQQLFNAFFNCESEQRMCFGNNNDDSDVQTGIDQWHSVCDKKITFTPTTPIVTSLATPINGGFCTTAFSACEQGNQLAQQCSRSHTDLGAQFSSCYCQPQILSLEYTCLFLGNVSCEAVPATLSNMAQYKFCSNFVSVLGSLTTTNSLPATVTASVTSSSSTSTRSSTSLAASVTSSITKPTLPGSSTSTLGSQSTSSSTNSGCRKSAPAMSIAIGFGVMVVWQALRIIA